MKKILNVLNEGEELTIKDILGGCLFVAAFFATNWILCLIEQII